MIFVTVGTQAPFDRLVAAMDNWAAGHQDQCVIAQVGNSNIAVGYLRAQQWMTAATFENTIREAELVVSHAGMGTILTARRHGVPALVMPRKVELGEHRDDHQRETARRLADLGVVQVAWCESDLAGQIDALLQGGFRSENNASTRAALVAVVRNIVNDLIRG